MASDKIPMVINIPVIIDTLEFSLGHLQKNHANMPVRQLQAERGECMQVATAILNDADLDIPREQWDRLYNIVLELDRVGY